MPNRIIRDSCRSSPSLASISDLAERVFWRLIVMFDDFGRYHGDPKALMAGCFPVGARRLTTARFVTALEELEAGDLLRFYEVGGRKYCYSPTWAKYQRLRASKSQFPEPVDSKGGGHLTANDGDSRSSAAGVGVGNGVGNDPPIAPQGGPSNDGFEAFWKAYPNKTGRVLAEKSWRKAKKKPPLEAILAAIERQKNGRKWIDGYITNPSTWLNQGRWDDMVDPVEPDLPELRRV